MSADSDDLAQELFVQPLLDALQPSSTVECRIDDVACSLIDHKADVVWLRGEPTWHSLRAITPTLAELTTRNAVPPVVFVAAGSEHTNEGVRLGLRALGEELDSDGRVLWWAPGGVGAFVPSARLPALAHWLDERGALYDEINALHRRNAELDTRSLALFELLDQSQHNGVELVRSLRFRVGTRVVRLGRRLRRNERIFRAPVEILARKPRVEQWRRTLATEHPPDRSAPSAAPRVTYIVPELRLSGGVLAVLQLVRELRRAGVDARVVAMKDRRHETFSWWLATRPKLYANADALAHHIAPTDIVVATHWQTAAAARAAVETGRARHAAYFLQDYEPWFVPEDDAEGQARVRATFALIPHRIVTSEWLRTRLADDGYDAEKLSLGVDLEQLYPRPTPRSDQPIVLAMARPRTPRRGFATLVDALARVHRAVPGAEIVLFGEDLRDVDVPFPYRAEGVVSDREQLAALYSAARVYVDLSDFQAFGLPNVEAMACGTTSVVTDVGGVHEYAAPGENCLTVPPRDPGAAAQAITNVLTDDALRNRLSTGALNTAAQLSIRVVAQRTRELFEKISAGSSAP